MSCLRWAAVLALPGLFFAMLGPFHGAERAIGLTDKPAHALGFFIVTACLTLIAPRLGLWRTALLAIALGAGVEAVQGLTGRSANPFDLLADIIGVAAASGLRLALDRLAPGLLYRR